MIREVLGRTRDGGSCASCDADYRGLPYVDEGRGYRVVAEIEPGLEEPINLCPDCFEEVDRR